MGIVNMGAHLNVYTNQEQTVFYVNCFARDEEIIKKKKKKIVKQ